MIKSFALYILLLVPVLYTPWAHSEANIQWGTITFANNFKINVEIADTESLRRYGLMHRTQLGPSAGMLFIYPDQALRAVWMKNTLIALDILFLSDSGKIVSMLPNLPPCKNDPCSVYSSTFDARYMLEVNAGFINSHGVTIGQKLTLDYPIEHSKQME